MSSKAKTTGIKNDEKPALTPKLRFPEFREDPKWELKPFGELFSIRNGRDYKHLSPGDVPVYGSGGYMLSVDDYLYDGESVCIGRKGTIDNPMFLTGKFWTVDTLFYTDSFNECVPKFIYAIFQSINWLKHNEAGGVPSLSKANIEQIKAAIPKPFEQQKIAECLNSVDELIAAQARKLDALKTHKKGLMQQLFPRGGETQPRLRFPEFQGAGEWEEKEVGEVFKVTRGEVLSMTLVQDEKSSEAVYPVYSSQTKRNGLSGYYSDYLYENAITWTTDGANAGDVNYRSGKFYCTNVCGVLINAEGYANPCVAALINSVSRSHVSYVGNPKLMNGIMAKITIPFPTVEEQLRISNCLSSLEGLIAAQTQKLDALKTQKKGLMQQLFPSPAEVEA
jgi:type I restriction enzyme, S subunit